MLALCVLSAPAVAHALDDEHIRAAVDAVVLPLMSRHDIPGMAVALAVDGRSLVFNFGVASKEPRAPVTDATLFEIGSVSKTLTATLAAYAQATGRLSMDQHPSRHLPELKGTAIDKATLLDLGTYTAGGLPLQFPDEVEDNDALSYFRAWKPTAAPGAVRVYSNPSLGLFGVIAAKALKRDFATALETQVFPAFGMSSPPLFSSGSHKYLPRLCTLPTRVPSRVSGSTPMGQRSGFPRRRPVTRAPWMALAKLRRVTSTSGNSGMRAKS